METVKLGALFKIGSSKRVLKSDWRDNGIPFYRGREITALSKRTGMWIMIYSFLKNTSLNFHLNGVPQTGDIVVLQLER